MTVYEVWDWLLAHGSDTDEVYVDEHPDGGMAIVIVSSVTGTIIHTLALEAFR